MSIITDFWYMWFAIAVFFAIILRSKPDLTKGAKIGLSVCLGASIAVLALSTVMNFVEKYG